MVAPKLRSFGTESSAFLSRLLPSSDTGLRLRGFVGVSLVKTLDPPKSRAGRSLAA
jgi:hypothetical protein